MLNASNTQGIYLNVPMTGWVLLKELIRKFGWQAETREQFIMSSKNRCLAEREGSPAHPADKSGKSAPIMNWHFQLIGVHCWILIFN